MAPEIINPIFVMDCDAMKSKIFHDKASKIASESDDWRTK